MKAKQRPVNITIKQCLSANDRDWLELRRALWPQDSPQQHLAEMKKWMAKPDRHSVFLACDSSGNTVGFAEASIRWDYVNGTETTPVAFLEGIYVTPGSRRQGTARALISAVEKWAAANNCREMASDADIENFASHALHKALGFEETERVVYFRKMLK